MHGRVTVLNHFNGDKLCIPGLATRENNWTVPGSFDVRQLKVGSAMKVNDDDISIDKDSIMHIVCVLWFDCNPDTKLTADIDGWTADDGCPLSYCARSGEVRVGVRPWGHSIEIPFRGLPCEEKPEISLEDIPTPASPWSSSSDSRRRRKSRRTR